MRKLTRLAIGTISAFGIAVLSLGGASASPASPARSTASVGLLSAGQISAAQLSAAQMVVAPATPQDLYVPIKPCRVVDTRVQVGPIGSGVTRTYYVNGTSGFAPQGGASGGCGVPAGAVGVTATLSAVTPSHAGYLRAWAAGGAEPGATLLNYGTGNTSTGTSVQVKSGTGKNLAVKNYGGPTQLVIDVTGYYIPQIHARVTNAGVLDWSTSPVLSASRLQAGIFVVTVDRSLTGCAATASAHGGSPLFTSTGITGSTVIVYVWHADGTPADAYFYLDVAC
jgi:hypothetical protein